MIITWLVAADTVTTGAVTVCPPTVEMRYEVPAEPERETMEGTMVTPSDSVVSTSTVDWTLVVLVLPALSEIGGGR